MARAELLCVGLSLDIPRTALLLVDADLRVRMAAGPRWERAEDPVDELPGRELEDLLEGVPLEVVRREFRAALRGETRRFELDFGAVYRATAVPVLTDAGEVAGVLALAYDEGGELRAERVASAELARRLTQQSAVARLGELALRRPALDVLRDAACEAVAAGLDTELVYVLEHSGTDGEMCVRAGIGWEPGFVGSCFEMASFADAVGRDRYAAGPVVINDLPNEPSWRARPLRAHGVVSAATVVIGKRTGLLGAYSRQHHTFSQQDLDFLTAVAHVLNGAVEGRQAEERIRHDALHDALTGLPNRTLLLERLRQALATADAKGERLAVFFLDVDHLKVLNDSLGHHAGDELLRAIGPRLRAVLRAEDTIARFGGDEFAVLCERVSDEGHALRVAERLVRAFAKPFEVGGEPRFYSTSVGVVVSDP
ncbi:MAG: hypothetical protein QOE28_1369, partial [Solirubrobacteraceae bacterium]|nr:hypothetical protein [Solirubrobacteraceae bacterium]